MRRPGACGACANEYVHCKAVWTGKTHAAAGGDMHIEGAQALGNGIRGMSGGIHQVQLEVDCSRETGHLGGLHRCLLEIGRGRWQRCSRHRHTGLDPRWEFQLPLCSQPVGTAAFASPTHRPCTRQQRRQQPRASTALGAPCDWVPSWQGCSSAGDGQEG